MITPADIRRSREMSPTVRTCAASVCRAAVSQRLGVTSARAIDKKTGAWTGRDVDKRLGTSNRAAGWTRGHLPSDEAVALVQNACGVDLREWRDLPLWKMLDPRTPSLDCILKVFQPLAGGLPLVVRLATHDEAALRHAQLEYYDYLNLRNEISIDRLTALVALARNGERQGDVCSHALAALCVFDLLPQVVRVNTPLQAGAPHLFALCRDVLWSKVELAGVVIDLSEGAFCRLLRETPLPSGVLKIGAADIYQIHARLIRRARLYGRPAGSMERKDIENPFPPGDPRHWYWTTAISRFVRNICPIEPCPEEETASLSYSQIQIDASVMMRAGSGALE